MGPSSTRKPFAPAGFAARQRGHAIVLALLSLFLTVTVGHAKGHARAASAPISQPVSSISQAVAAGTTCAILKGSNIEDLPPGIEILAEKEVRATNDAACLAHVALVHLGRGDCDAGKKIADQAARISSAEPVVKLAQAVGHACALSQSAAAALVGAPVRCNEQTLALITDGLAQGALLDDWPGATELALGTLQSIAKICRDEHHLLLSVLDVVAHRLPEKQQPCPADLRAKEEGKVTGEKTPMGLSGYVLRCQFRSTLDAGLVENPVVLRHQARVFLAETLHLNGNCLSSDHGSCLNAAQALLLADDLLTAERAQSLNIGLALDDLLYLARADGLHDPVVLKRAALALPMWSVPALHEPSTLQLIDELLGHLRTERGHLGGAILTLKLELARTFGVPGDACQRANEVHRALATFGTATTDMVTDWGEVAFDAAQGGLKLARQCATGSELAGYFGPIVAAIKELPPRNPFLIQKLNYENEAPVVSNHQLRGKR